ncbi:hypothetical protein M9458_041670, partial [Cirrhinus mrigala]
MPGTDDEDDHVPWERHGPDGPGGSLRGIHDVISINPQSFLGTVPLPVYKVLKVAASLPGVKDLVDSEDVIGDDLGQRRRRGSLVLCGWRENRRFQQGNVE